VLFDFGGTLAFLDYELLADEFSRRGPRIDALQLEHSEYAGRRWIDEYLMQGNPPSGIGAYYDYFRAWMVTAGYPGERVEELRARLRAADRLTSMQCELIKYATTDSLTGLLNRRAFLEDASEACAAASTNNPISTILFDIDHFKSINDGHGHETGDVVLATVGTAAKMVANGTVGRIGGEEFCILEHCDLADAVELAETLRTSVKNLKFSKGEVGSISCSFGVAEWEPGDTVDRLLRRADVAMYEAKSTGRDRVVATDQFAIPDRRDGWRDMAIAAKRVSR